MDALNPNPNSGKDGCVQGIGHGNGRIDPRGLKWVILDQHATKHYVGLKWECDTDVEVHLFAYVSCEAPKKKRGTHVKRGVVFHHAAEVYWSYRDIVCQEEEGFTTHHTFFFRCYPGCLELWWRCGGRTTEWVRPFAPIWSASRSPFYHWTCLYVGPFQILYPNAPDHWAWNPHPPELAKWECIDEVVPDGEATYIGLDHARAWGHMYGPHTYPDYPPYPISEVVVSMVAMQKSGTDNYNLRTRPCLHRAGSLPSEYYYGSEYTFLTPEWQTLYAFYPVNPWTGNPWNYGDINDFDLAEDHDGVGKEFDYYGPVLFTQIQMALFVPE